jgi:hypothetical protein
LQAERIDAELSSNYSDLKDQYDHWRRRHNTGLALVFAGLLAPYVAATLVVGANDLIGAMVLIVLLIVAVAGLPIKYETIGLSGTLRQLAASSANQVLVGSLGISLICLPLGAGLALRAGEQVTDIEKLFLRFYDVTLLVQRSLDRKSTVSERAFKMLGGIIEHIEDDWEIPNEIDTLVDSRDISDFKQNLSNRLLGAVRKGDQKSLAALIQIDKALLKPGLESLSRLNSWMQNNLPISEVAERHGILYRILSRYLTPNRVIFGVLIASAIVGCVFYWMCIGVVGVSKDTSVLGAVAVFAALFGGYMAKTRK